MIHDAGVRDLVRDLGRDLARDLVLKVLCVF